MKKRLGIRINKDRFSLTLLLAGVVFAVLLVAVLMAGGLVVLLIHLKVFGDPVEDIKLVHIVLAMSLISLVIGSAVVMLLGKFPLKPINKLVNGMNALAAGDFKTRIRYGGPIGNHPTFNEITESFNTLAAELENTEVLRTDFINNFSHEFKTPIVSIAGFAKLLKKGTLTEEQRLLYLNAIEEESLRLSCMATNVLNLTKVESQSILTDLSRFNLSEQIRSVVLLTAEKWEEKKLDLQPDFEEYEIEANEELLKQVWINLVDNAVKFTPRCGTVGISIREENGRITVSVQNTGKEIPPEMRNKIFHKFYQGEESHTHEGNGIGLAIVKRVVELHSGSVTVKSENGMTEFTVTLPKEQGETDGM